jgi:hypothetical protein
MARTGDGLVYIRLRVKGGSERVFDPVPLDDFVRVVDAMGPQRVLHLLWESTRPNPSFHRTASGGRRTFTRPTLPPTMQMLSVPPAAKR